MSFPLALSNSVFLLCLFVSLVRYEEAAETFRKASLLDPKNSSALHYQAECLLALGMLVE
jgi:Flp pilus assembly protein TadD